MTDPLALVPSGALAVFAGAVVLGVVHGAEPGHGWPIAATYALDREHTWWTGFLASFLLGVGHLVSSLAVVAVFFLAKSSFDLVAVDAPLSVLGVRIGGPVSVVAGVLLIGLGVREYRHGRGRGHGHAHGHSHDQTADVGRRGTPDRDLFRYHEDDLHTGPVDRGHDRADDGVGARIAAAIPFVGGHSHDHPTADDLDTRGLWGIVWTAFVLGFAHEEEIEIIGMCLGSVFCLELMLVYALAVIVALVGLTMLFIAGFEHYGERVEGLAEHFPTVSAAVLSVMGLGFVAGVL